MSGKFQVLLTLLTTIILSLGNGIGVQARDLPGTGKDAGKTVIYRDSFGVPHIYAPTVVAGMYAMGWAQAQDRPQQLLKNFLLAIGEYASIAGPAGVQSDIRSHMWDHYGVAKRNASRINPEIRRQNRAFAQGMNDYYAAHPDDLPEWWGNRQVDEFMVIAFGRLFLFRWSIDEAYDDLKRGGIQPGFEHPKRGSNEWAVAPVRSAVGAAMLLIDPHLSWWGPSRFWAFRIHAGALKGSGVTLLGSPGIGLGHNANVAWAMTTGGPDTADIYELTLQQGNPRKYLYDGAWLNLKQRDVTLSVRGHGQQTITIEESLQGPIIARRNGKAYAAAMAYADEVGVTEAWHQFNMAKDYRGMMAGMATLQLFPQNVMVADTAGNIYYQRTGRVPQRSLKYDWSRPVDGSTSATRWRGFHAASDHVQILNPPQGYMQNCNITPQAMMLGSPLTPDHYRPYLYKEQGYRPRGGWIGQRAARALDLLSHDNSVTIEEALAYAVDVHPAGVERWLKVLRTADQKFGRMRQSNADYVAGIKDLLHWNLQLSNDSTGALKYYYWRDQLLRDFGDEAMAKAAASIDPWFNRVIPRNVPDLDLSDAELQSFATSFENAMARLKADMGSLEAVYGDKFRVGRGQKSWPVGGGGGRLGLTTLRNVSYGPEKPDKTRWGRSGQTSTQIVVLTQPIQSWMYLPVGESDRPASPHYTSYAERAFSRRQLQPTWWLPQDLAEHIESRQVLTH